MIMGITTLKKWSKIDWSKETRTVAKLQHKIYRYSINNNKASVEATQKALVQILSAKLLAVRRVSQDNRDKKSPFSGEKKEEGLDGVKSLKLTQRIKLAKTLSLDGKASPIRRVWISKASELWPLGISPINDQAKQQLVR
jgi:RNA-directed DNA polymerase